MTKEDFYKEMEKVLTAQKPEKMEIDFTRIDKPNRPGLHACILQMPGTATSPTFYFEDLYETCSNGATPEELASALIDFAQKVQADPLGGIDFDDYECVRKNLGLIVISEKNNIEYLKKMVYRKYEDLAVIPIIFTNDQSGVGCVKIKKSFLENWSVTEDEIFEEAVMNAPKITPPIFRGLNNTFGFPQEDDAPDLYVITNKYYAGGASVAFYPGYLDAIEQVLGELFILPSSVNELIVVHDIGQDPEILLQIVKHVNRNEVDTRDVLSDAVYHYSHKDGFRKILPAD